MMKISEEKMRQKKIVRELYMKIIEAIPEDAEIPLVIAALIKALESMNTSLIRVLEEESE